jgi:hypothetical protein
METKTIKISSSETNRVFYIGSDSDRITRILNSIIILGVSVNIEFTSNPYENQNH